MADNDNNDDKLSAEDKARAQAEARRQKILSKAENRLDMVTGVSARDSINASEEDTANAEQAAAKDAKAAKLAAMRRRRFKKGGGAAKKDEAKADEATMTTEETKPAAADDAKPAVKEEENAKPKEETPPAAAAEAKPAQTKAETTTKSAADEPKTEEAPETETKETSTPDTTADADAQPESATSAAPKKKYMGVAKMRRKMNKERQQEREQQQETDASSPALHHVAKKKKTRSVLPIVMHLTVTFLLFWAGLDVGLQQGRIDYSAPLKSSSSSEVITVYTILAPQQQGLRLLDTVTGYLGVSGGGSRKNPKKKDGLDQLVQDTAAYQVHDEEFDSDTVETKETVEKNIDPLFQVDLDLYTQGSGLFMMAGRFAVAVHRLNLQLFYYGPKGLVQRLTNGALSLVNSPPMLCLVTLALRQAVGKLLLGAHLPDPQDASNGGSGSGGAKSGKDVLSMVKNMAKNFFTKAFPTAATLYDMWTHLRADMYVILCGLFVGIAWHHYTTNVLSTTTTPPSTTTTTKEVLVDDKEETISSQHIDSDTVDVSDAVNAEKDVGGTTTSDDDNDIKKEDEVAEECADGDETCDASATSEEENSGEEESVETSNDEEEVVSNDKDEEGKHTSMSDEL